MPANEPAGAAESGSDSVFFYVFFGKVAGREGAICEIHEVPRAEADGLLSAYKNFVEADMAFAARETLRRGENSGRREGMGWLDRWAEEVGPMSDAYFNIVEGLGKPTLFFGPEHPDGTLLEKEGLAGFVPAKELLRQMKDNGKARQ